MIQFVLEFAIGIGFLSLASFSSMAIRRFTASRRMASIHPLVAWVDKQLGISNALTLYSVLSLSFSVLGVVAIFLAIGDIRGN